MKSILFLLLFLLTLSCIGVQEELDEKQELTDTRTSYPSSESILEITLEQQAAFDALNTLQTSTDERSRLYSTFAGNIQDCYPADTSFIISRSDLRTAMHQFVIKHCKHLSFQERDSLVATAVLAQEEYVVLHCNDLSFSENYENGLPMTGTWVMPSVLDQRDVVLVW